MPELTLFVCQSCNNTFHKGVKPSQGASLLEQLRASCSKSSELEIQAVDCLWMCSQACVTAVSAPNQPTYLFTDLPSAESAEALLEFVEIYRNQKGEAIPYRQLPDVLKSANIAKIPPAK
jgi:predicted metal-binding protein